MLSLSTYLPTHPSALRITASLPPTSASYLSFASLPLSPRRPPSSHHSRTHRAALSALPPPQVPPAWTWTCHQCHSSYPLGATRRCLHDSHYFCAGMTQDRHSGRVKRHRACGSTFDYSGWTAWGKWRDDLVRVRESARAAQAGSASEHSNRHGRDAIQVDEDYEANMDVEVVRSSGSKGNCSRDCHFPSECRWSPRIAETEQAKTEMTSPSTPKANVVASKALEVKMENTKPSGSTSPSVASKLVTKLFRSVEKRARSSSTSSSSPTSPASPPSPSPSLPPSRPATSPQPSSSSSIPDSRAPVLDFAAFKAKLDRANLRQSLTRGASKLPELQLGSSRFSPVEPMETIVESVPTSPDRIAVGEGTKGESGEPWMMDQDDGDSDSDGDASITEEVFDKMDIDVDEKIEGERDVLGERRWDWGTGGFDSGGLAGVDMAGLLDLSEQTWNAMMMEDD